MSAALGEVAQGNRRWRAPEPPLDTGTALGGEQGGSPSASQEGGAGQRG
ncbi:MAG TPA: hypothetical protein VIC55_09785 [Gemmatimonadaceae bacterium]